MTNGLIPPVGDKGQRYEHWCDNGNGEPMKMGWSEQPNGCFRKCVHLQPAWSNYRYIDRKAAAEEGDKS